MILDGGFRDRVEHLPSPPNQVPWAPLPNSILTCSRIRFTVSPFCRRQNRGWLLGQAVVASFPRLRSQVEGDTQNRTRHLPSQLCCPPPANQTRVKSAAYLYPRHRPFPHCRWGGLGSTGDGIPKIKLPPTSQPGLASPSPLPPPEPQGSPLTPHTPTPPPRLTFPCISMRSVRVMLSSGSSSSPASEPLILSGGAGAEAAWEHVHTVAWPALREQWERG